MQMSPRLRADLIKTHCRTINAHAFTSLFAASRFLFSLSFTVVTETRLPVFILTFSRFNSFKELSQYDLAF